MRTGLKTVTAAAFLIYYNSIIHVHPASLVSSPLKTGSKQKPDACMQMTAAEWLRH